MQQWRCTHGACPPRRSSDGNDDATVEHDHNHAIRAGGIRRGAGHFTETDPNAADKALAQLRALGRQKWPTLAEAQSFINAVSDPENADLVRVATRTPKGSSPARQQNY